MGPKRPTPGQKAAGMKRGLPQDSDSDDQLEGSDSDDQLGDSDTDPQEESDSDAEQSDSDANAQKGDNDDESDDQEDDVEDDADSEGQNYQGMTMQELLKLQEEIGTKAFQQKVLKKGGGIMAAGKISSSKPTVMKTKSKPVLQRVTKNRPVEMPMMRHAAPRLATLDPGRSSKRMIVRDPRFDDLSGNLNLKAWQENYGFLKETRKKEKEVLKKELKAEQDPEKKRRMKSIIQRMENQEREQARREKEREVKREERQEQRDALRQGRKPKFVSNKERKLLVKAAHFEDLKKGNKLEKYLERKEKRLKAKEMKRKY